MNKFKCECGSVDFQRDAETHDTVVFHGYIDSCGDFVETAAGKEYVGETDWSDNVECSKCGKEYSLDSIWNNL